MKSKSKTIDWSPEGIAKEWENLEALKQFRDKHRVKPVTPVNQKEKIYSNI